MIHPPCPPPKEGERRRLKDYHDEVRAGFKPALRDKIMINKTFLI